MATKKKLPDPSGFTQEQMGDDELGKALVLACFHQIHAGHVQDYAAGALSSPSKLTAKQRTAFCEAMMQFASLGWITFHAMNRGRPIKDAPKPAGKARKKTS